MADLIFYTGAMGSSKTAHALMTRFQYTERGKKVWLIKPDTDTRDPSKLLGKEDAKILVRSRIGLEAWADVISTEEHIDPPIITNLIICDEAQFLTPSQVEELKMIADIRGMDVFCYGLKTDFKTYLFPGSKRLLELASKVIELPVICDCGNKAVVNARLANGNVVDEGELIDIGGDEKYKAFCYACWKRKLAGGSI